MKHSFLQMLLCFLLVSLGGAGAAEPRIPEEFRQLITHPPLIAHGKDASGMVYTAGENGVIIVEGEELFSLLSFSRSPGSAVVDYTFKSFSRRFGLEVEGKGQLEENVFRVSSADPDRIGENVLVIDRGSRDILNAGLFQIKWSQGGHLYHDGKLKFRKGGAIEYRALCREYWEKTGVK